MRDVVCSGCIITWAILIHGMVYHVMFHVIFQHSGHFALGPIVM
jgi:hypothetical protein